jgi:hypothetical protein
VRRERIDHHSWKRDRAHRRCGLRRRQEWRAASDADELPIDVYYSAQEVDLVNG